MKSIFSVRYLGKRCTFAYSFWIALSMLTALAQMEAQVTLIVQANEDFRRITTLTGQVGQVIHKSPLRAVAHVTIRNTSLWFLDIRSRSKIQMEGLAPETEVTFQDVILDASSPLEITVDGASWRSQTWIKNMLNVLWLGATGTPIPDVSGALGPLIEEFGPDGVQALAESLEKNPQLVLDKLVKLHLIQPQTTIPQFTSLQAFFGKLSGAIPILGALLKIKDMPNQKKAIDEWWIVSRTQKGEISLSGSIEDLLAYYPFNNNTKDESGNGHNGEAKRKSFTRDRFGHESNAFDFDGSNIITTNFKGIAGKQERTISFWLKKHPTASRHIPVLSYGGTGTCCTQGSTFGCYLYFDRSLSIGIDVQDGAIRYKPQIDNDEWHHYVWVVPKNVAKLSDIQLYQDAQPLSIGVDWWNGRSYSENATVNTITGPPLEIGRNAKATIDDIRVFGRALSESEIQDLFHEGGWKK